MRWLDGIMDSSGHEFEQIPGDGGGQGNLVCCSPQGHKESDMTSWLNSNSNYLISKYKRLFTTFWASRKVVVLNQDPSRSLFWVVYTSSRLSWLPPMLCWCLFPKLWFYSYDNSLPEWHLGYDVIISSHQSKDGESLIPQDVFHEKVLDNIIDDWT